MIVKMGSVESITFSIASKLCKRANAIYLLKESRYVRLANTLFRVLNKSRIPLFLLHKKSNHIFTVWQHIVVLLVLRQYEGKSYRMFVDWLVEAYYLRTVLRLSYIYHITPLFKSLLQE